MRKKEKHSAAAAQQQHGKLCAPACAFRGGVEGVFFSFRFSPVIFPCGGRCRALRREEFCGETNPLGRYFPFFFCFSVCVRLTWFGGGRIISKT